MHLHPFILVVLVLFAALKFVQFFFSSIKSYNSIIKKNPWSFLVYRKGMLFFKGKKGNLTMELWKGQIRNVIGKSRLIDFPKICQGISHYQSVQSTVKTSLFLLFSFCNRLQQSVIHDLVIPIQLRFTISPRPTRLSIQGVSALHLAISYFLFGAISYFLFPIWCTTVKLGNAM